MDEREYLIGLLEEAQSLDERLTMLPGSYEIHCMRRKPIDWLGQKEIPTKLIRLVVLELMVHSDMPEAMALLIHLCSPDTGGWEDTGG